MNNFMTLSLLANFPGAAAKMETGRPDKDPRRPSSTLGRIAEKRTADAEVRQYQQLQHDWRLLASEWLALMGTLEQFEQEFEQLEEMLMCRRQQRLGGNGRGAPQIRRGFEM